jgi:hypothetical protein
VQSRRRWNRYGNSRGPGTASRPPPWFALRGLPVHVLAARRRSVRLDAGRARLMRELSRRDVAVELWPRPYVARAGRARGDACLLRLLRAVAVISEPYSRACVDLRKALRRSSAGLNVSLMAFLRSIRNRVNDRPRHRGRSRCGSGTRGSIAERMPIGVIVYALLLFVFPHSTSSTTGPASHRTRSS